MGIIKHSHPKDLGRILGVLSLVGTSTFLPQEARAYQDPETSLVSPVIWATDADGVSYHPSRVYFQCGGELNGEVFPSNHLLVVTELRDDGGEFTLWGLEDHGSNPNQCP